MNIAAEWTNNNDMDINPFVERVYHVKLLGITFSNDLTWKRHVDNIMKKAVKKIYMQYQLKRACVNQADLVTVYIHVLRSVVE